MTLSPIAVDSASFLAGQSKSYSPQPSPSREALRCGLGSTSPMTDTPEVRMQLLRNQSNRTMMSIKGSREFERQLSSRIYAEAYKTRIHGCSLLPNPRRKSDQKHGGYRRGTRLSVTEKGAQEDAGEEAIGGIVAGSCESGGIDSMFPPTKSEREESGVLDANEYGALRKIGPR